MRAPCIPRAGPNPVSFDVIAPIPSRTPYRWNRDPIIRRMFLVPLIRGGMGCLLDDKSSSERQVPGDSRLVGGYIPASFSRADLEPVRTRFGGSDAEGASFRLSS